MPISFGMPALIEAPSLTQSLAIAKELGLNFVEINSNLPIYRLDKVDLEAMQDEIANSGLQVTLHLEEYLHLTDLDERVRKQYQEILKQEIIAAKYLGLPVLNLHLLDGVKYTLPDRVVHVFDVYETDFQQGVQELLDICEDTIGGAPMLIAIENLNGYNMSVKNAIAHLLTSPVFTLTWDVGHDICAQGADKDYLSKYEHRIKHMHLHDALLPNRPHLTLGEGCVDLDSCLRLADKNNMSCVVEVKHLHSLRQSVSWLRTHAYLD